MTLDAKKKYRELEKRLNEYTLELERIFDALNHEAARLALTTTYNIDIDDVFTFDKYPQTKKGVEQLQRKYVADVRTHIYSNTLAEWKNSNLLVDLLVDGVLSKYDGVLNRKKHTHYYQVNNNAYKAFIQRKDRGMDLSTKLWQQSALYKEELEAAISVALERGMSAVTLSKRLSQYLKDFPALQKEYGKKYGKAKAIYDCEYRSARLARTEINMAYRTAEQTRWGQLDFVVGYEVKLSNNHNCKGIPKGHFYDICDDLAGKYPKDFKFVGWHPQCRCYVVPILKSREEFADDLPASNEVKEVPKEFKKWMSDNKERYKKAEKRGTLPYFVRDNIKYLDNR